MRRVGNKILVLRLAEEDILEVCADLPLLFRIELAQAQQGSIFFDKSETLCYKCNDRTVSGKNIRFSSNNKLLDIVVDYASVRKSDYNPDLLCREHIDVSLITRKARDITRNKSSVEEKVAAICDYVAEIPIEEKDHSVWQPSDVYDSDFIIKNNIAKKCAEKSTLFEDLCRSIGIPSRSVGGFYDSGIKGIYPPIPEETLCPHGWAIYFDGNGWKPVDPTFGYFGNEFKKENYFLNSDIIKIKGRNGYSITFRN